jgi:DNA-binding transcriptional regulator YhcF (GntR family)
LTQYRKAVQYNWYKLPEPPLPDLIPEPRLARALDAARAEAGRRGHDRVATRHLMLGLLAVPESVAVAIVRSLAVEPDTLRRRVEGSLPRRRSARDPSTLPWSANARRALGAAEREARTLVPELPAYGALPGVDAPLIRTEHVLFALLELDGGVARILSDHRITAEAAREQWQRLLGLSSPGLPFLRINPHSATPVYQQIVDQVREAVAAGRLRAGDRMPTVRQLAADLDVAPGTTARAYQELEQIGLVVTERARGTRVAPPRAPDVPHPDRAAALIGLLRPVAVSATYLGASADEIRTALEQALAGLSLQRDTTSS